MTAFEKYRGPAFIGLVILVGLVIGFWPTPGLAERTATAPAQIVSATKTSWDEGGSLFTRRSRTSHRSGYQVVYRFTVDGRAVSGVSDKNFWYKEGEQCRVCYEPANPSNSDLRDATSGAPCGSKFFTR